jgi:hypothetical protein
MEKQYWLFEDGTTVHLNEDLFPGWIGRQLPATDIPFGSDVLDYLKGIRRTAYNYFRETYPDIHALLKYHGDPVALIVARPKQLTLL